jgi:hypothetical protein
MNDEISLDEELAIKLDRDYTARLQSEKSTGNLTQEMLRATASALSFQTRFQCFSFLSQRISQETVLALLLSIQFSSRLFNSYIGTPNGVNIFADHYLQPVLMESDPIPIDLVKMMRHAAFTIAQTFTSSDSIGTGDSIPRILAIARWFEPWNGFNIADGAYFIDCGKRLLLKKGKSFIQFFTDKKNAIELSSKRDISEEEISQWRSSIEMIFPFIELDSDMIDILFRKNKSKLVDPSVHNMILFCIQHKLKEIFRVLIPEVPVPSQWQSESEVQKLFCGSDKSLYPQWRQKAMETLLNSENNKSGGSVIAGLLKNPIAAEIEVVLGFSSKNSGAVSAREIFEYLDRSFNFKTDKIWMESELYKNIKKAISGITAKSEKATAILASTWKCETFEEYMRIVSLF